MGDAKRRATAIKTGTVEGCGNCRFYLDDPMSKGGVFRRLPPVPVMLGLKNGPNGVYPEVGTCWPEVMRDRWCGEYDATVAASLGQMDFSGLDMTEGTA